MLVPRYDGRAYCCENATRQVTGGRIGIYELLRFDDPYGGYRTSGNTELMRENLSLEWNAPMQGRCHGKLRSRHDDAGRILQSTFLRMYQVWNALNVAMRSSRHSGFAPTADPRCREILNPRSRAPSH